MLSVFLSGRPDPTEQQDTHQTLINNNNSMQNGNDQL